MDGITNSMNGHKFEEALEDMKDREAGRAAVHGVTKSQTRLSDKQQQQYSYLGNVSI